MKKQIFALSAALMLAFGSFTYANTFNKSVSNAPSTNGSGEDDALYCKKTDKDGNTWECWFCKCSDLKL